MSYLILFFSIVFVSEKYFPVYHVWIEQNDGSFIQYDIPKKDFFDEAGMLKTDALEKLGGL